MMCDFTVRFYCGKEMIGVHSALADSQAALKVCIEQVSRASFI